MKNLLPAILIGGAPDAGKSALTHNLARKLRELDVPHYVFRASRDGEGDWFFEGDPEYVRQIRVSVRGKWPDTFIQFVCQTIKNRLMPLIVDIGGLPTERDNPIFHACTHSILLLKDEEKEATQTWHDFTTSNGLTPLAELRSQLSGHSKLTAREPVLMGTIVGLERRQRAYGPAFNALVERICELFEYPELERLHLDAAKTEDVVHLDQRLEALDHGANEWTPDLLEPLLAEVSTQTELSVYGRGPAWVYGALALHAKTKPFHQFDPCLNWVEPPSLRSGTLEQPAESLVYIEEPKLQGDAYILTIRLTHYYIDYTEKEQLAFPDLSPDHGVIVSGKLPLWLFTALARFYADRDVPWIALHDARKNKAAFVIYSRVETHTIGDRLPM